MSELRLSADACCFQDVCNQYHRLTSPYSQSADLYLRLSGDSETTIYEVTDARERTEVALPNPIPTDGGGRRN